LIEIFPANSDCKFVKQTLMGKQQVPGKFPSV
jgi:hypothetical protein